MQKETDILKPFLFQTLTPNVRKIFLHALIAAFFIAFEVLVVKMMGSPLHVGYFLPYYLPDLLLFYGNAIIVMRLWSKKGKWISLLFVVMELACHFVLWMWIDVEINNRLLMATTRSDFLRAGYRSVYILFISVAYGIVERNKKQSREIFQLKLQALELQNHQVALENAYLRAKANPHLTFNVLHVLYGAIYKKMPPEATAVKLLTDVMDYSMGTTDRDGKVALVEEVAHLKKIIALYQYLNRNTYQIRFVTNIRRTDNNPKIPPLILATLMDNVFKHGQLDVKYHPAVINVVYQNNTLRFSANNLKQDCSAQSHGLGLVFVKNCLSFYYPGKFELTETNDNDHYAIRLIIEL